MTIATGLSATKTGFDLIKILRETMGKPDVNPGDIQARLVELQSLMLDAQRALADAEAENRELRSKLDDKTALKELEADLAFVQDGGFLVKKSDRENGILNPLCPICWGQNKQVISMMPMADGYYHCVIHKADYHTQGYRDEEDRIRRSQIAGSGNPNSWMG